MELRLRLTNEMKEGMRSRDTERVSVIRLLFATIKNKEIEKGKGTQLSDDEILKVVVSAAKQRKESIEQFSKSDRDDLVEKEKRELVILQTYMPEPLSEETLRVKVKEAITQVGATDIKQMGAVMKVLMPQLAGRADGNLLRKMVESSLQRKQ